jgi:uncharacterized protein Smg (DUF494 family)
MNTQYSVERVLDIIADLISGHMAGAALASIDTRPLHDQGYTDSEIAAAISWMLERRADRDELEDLDHDGFRILHGIERELVSPDAWGMLLTYHEHGFLTSEDVENLLERAVVMGHERHVGAHEMKSLITAYIMNQNPLLPTGNRISLLGSDSVN